MLFCNPDYYCVAHGKTGELLVGPVEVAKLVKLWAAYASPAVLRRADQPPLVYLGGAYSARCVLAPSGERGLWREFLPTDTWPLLADLNNDGTCEAVVSVADGHVYVLGR